MEVLRLNFDRLQNFLLHLQLFRLLDQIIGLAFQLVDGLFIVGYLRQELAIDGFLVQILCHKSLSISHPGRSFNLLEGKLNSFKLLHFLLDLISQHLVDKNMSQEDLPPLLLAYILVLNSPLGNLHQVGLSLRVGVLQLHLLLDH